MWCVMNDMDDTNGPYKMDNVYAIYHRDVHKLMNMNFITHDKEVNGDFWYCNKKTRSWNSSLRVREEEDPLSFFPFFSSPQFWKLCFCGTIWCMHCIPPPPPPASVLLFWQVLNWSVTGVSDLILIQEFARKVGGTRRSWGIWPALLPHRTGRKQSVHTMWNLQNTWSFSCMWRVTFNQRKNQLCWCRSSSAEDHHVEIGRYSFLPFFPTNTQVFSFFFFHHGSCLPETSNHSTQIYQLGDYWSGHFEALIKGEVCSLSLCVLSQDSEP